jgi:C-terminal processing protease CtpA/Prc
MPKHLSHRLLIWIGRVGAAVTLAGAALAEPAPPPHTPAADPAPVAALPLDELRTFAEVYGRIKDDYVEGVGDKTLLEGAIRGMLSALDPHSAYLTRTSTGRSRSVPAASSAVSALRSGSKTGS